METCPRCGSFAVLVDARFGRLCAPCVPLSRHPAQLANGDPLKLLAALGGLLREVGWLYVAVILALGVPPVVLQLSGAGPDWLWTIVFVVTMSLGESIVFVTWQERVLKQRPRAGIPWRLALVRFGPALWVNVVGAVAMTLCFPASIFYGCVVAAVAIAVLEDGGPIESFLLAWRRSAGQRVGLSVGFVVTSMPVSILLVLSVGVGTFVRLTPGTHIEVERALVLSTLLTSLTLIPANLFQAVAWLATLPHEDLAPVPDAPGDASPAQGAEAPTPR